MTAINGGSGKLGFAYGYALNHTIINGGYSGVLNSPFNLFVGGIFWRECSFYGGALANLQNNHCLVELHSRSIDFGWLITSATCGA